MGFYTVIWGKSKEQINEIWNDADIESTSDDGSAPLLKNKSVSS